jgi:serine/threonine protein kinase
MLPSNDRHVDWNRVQSVFLSLVDLSPEDQAQRLDTTCADDSQLRAEVESLLESDRDDPHVISATIASEAALLFGERTLIGDRLGAYLVVKEIGRGGMGDVYLATRDDDQFQKQVAIKVVRRGMDTADVLGRFQHERQILANLDHPYIARLLDGGTTFDGRPFFVMDYVEGQPLEVFCGDHKPDIKTRCQLFLRILEAVAYAHRNLVVHRDLKPGNIFVTSDGSPKLLDFGVAKLIAADAGPGVTAASTARPFTPEYASPEQVQGLPVTTATDIYSLGAVLYELLTNQRAQPMATITPNEIERVICQTEVRRPSLLAPDLDSDLDNIVLMAMRKEPGRRYQSVDQLAEDVRQYLRGRPVLARQDSFWYRARKFARRNRFEIAGTALIFASLVVALVVALSQSREAQSARHAAEAQKTIAERERVRAEAGFTQAELARAAESQQRVKADQQRDEAVLERARAEQRLTQLFNLADKTLFQIHDAVAKLPGATEARQTLVRTTLDYLESIEKEHGLDDRMRLALGAGYARTAAIQGDPTHPSLGDFEGARRSYQKAEVVLAPLYLRKKNDPDVITRWLEVEGGLAELQYRHFNRQVGIERYQGLVPISHRLAELAPSDPSAVKREAELQGMLAIAVVPTDKVAARNYANREIAIMTALIGRFPEDRDLKQDLGSALASVAGSLTAVGDLTPAAEYYRRSIEIREQLLNAEPHDALLQRNLLVAYGNYAALLGIPWSANVGRSAEARKYCEKSVVLARALAASDPQDQTARYDLAISLGHLGMVEPEPEQIAGSLKSLEEALAILDPIIKANPNSTSIINQAAMVRQYAGYRLRSLGQLEAAAGQFRLALAELELMISANPGQPMGITTALSNEEGLAGIYAAWGDRVAALQHANHAVDRAEKYSASSPNLAVPLGHLGTAYFELASVERTLHDWDRASEAAEHAASLWRTIHDPSVLSVHKQAREQLEVLVREIAAHH